MPTFGPSMPTGYGPGPVNVPVTPGGNGKKGGTFDPNPKTAVPSSLTRGPGAGALGPAGPVGPPPSAPTTDPGAEFLQSPLAQFMASLGNQNQGVGNYLHQFQSSLGAARSNIQQQLGAALADIQNSQNAAGQALGQLPAQIDQSYGQAHDTTQSALAAIQGAQAKSGVGSLMDLNAYMQPVQAAVSGSQAAAHANVPLLQTGIQQEGDRMRAQANMAAMAQQGQLDQLGAQGMLQAGLAQSNQGLTPQQQFQSQLLLAQQDNAAKMDQIKAQQGQTTDLGARYHDNPVYTHFAGQIANGNITTKADLQKALYAHPDLLGLLMSEYGAQLK